MVNMIGFHHREPTYNTAGPEEDGFFINLRPRPTNEHPMRASLRTPTARATFDNPGHAQLWADHPGAFPAMVADYLEWASASKGVTP